jgi:hypothetical protein
LRVHCTPCTPPYTLHIHIHTLLVCAGRRTKRGVLFGHTLSSRSAFFFHSDSCVGGLPSVRIHAIAPVQATKAGETGWQRDADVCRRRWYVRGAYIYMCVTERERGLLSVCVSCLRRYPVHSHTHICTGEIKPASFTTGLRFYARKYSMRWFFLAIAPLYISSAIAIGTHVCVRVCVCVSHVCLCVCSVCNTFCPPSTKLQRTTFLGRILRK